MLENVFLALLTPLRDASACASACHHDAQRNDIQYKGLICGTQHNITLPLCWVSHFVYRYAERRCAECRYAERR